MRTPYLTAGLMFTGRSVGVMSARSLSPRPDMKSWAELAAFCTWSAKRSPLRVRNLAIRSLVRLRSSADMLLTMSLVRTRANRDSTLTKSRSRPASMSRGRITPTHRSEPANPAPAPHSPGRSSVGLGTT